MNSIAQFHPTFLHRAPGGHQITSVPHAATCLVFVCFVILIVCSYVLSYGIINYDMTNGTVPPNSRTYGTTHKMRHNSIGQRT